MYPPIPTTSRRCTHTASSASASRSAAGGSYHARGEGRSEGPRTVTVSEWTKPGVVFVWRT